MLDGNLGGLHHQKMLIDTGAVPSAISIRVAKRLGLLGSVQELSLMNRSIAVERVAFLELIGSGCGRGIGHGGNGLGRIEQALGTRIDAVFGLDLLARRTSV